MFSIVSLLYLIVVLYHILEASSVKILHRVKTIVVFSNSQLFLNESQADLTLSLKGYDDRKAKQIRYSRTIMPCCNWDAIRQIEHAKIRFVLSFSVYGLKLTLDIYNCKLDIYKLGIY